MTLKDYHRKRKPASPEPGVDKQARAFVVQKHAARQLHYDFRLELNRVLKSWAVPKGISLNPADKRLAVQVEDHPRDYLTFEGIIPKGQYGAGSVEVWDIGVYYPLDAERRIGNTKTMNEGLRKGEITFLLKGKKLSGIFSLIKMKNSDKNWLIIKHKETVMPQSIEPMLAYLADKPFDDSEWLFEVKWDGFRAIAEVENQKVSLYSRNHQSLNERFSPIVKALQELKIKSAIFDGELVIVDKKGISHFQDLQNYQKTGEGDLRYYIFDLLYYEGRDLRKLPLLERKQLLESILPSDPTSLLLRSDHLIGKGIKFFELAKKQGLEGIMAKASQSTYQSKRSRDWLKIKTHTRQEAVICGYTEPRGSRKQFGALILGVKEKGKWRYIGHVGGGFDQSRLADVKKQLEPLIIGKCPFETPPETNMPVTWLKPKLVCEVSFAEWTQEHIMRQPIFIGMRSDKEEAKEGYTHLDKVYWPKEEITKGELLDYYRQIAPFILPYLKDRPIILHRFPNGIEEEGFYQKHADPHFPDWVPTVKVEHEGKAVNYLQIPDLESLLFAINLGSIDLHPFNSRIPHLNHPDYLAIDLDPENIAFEKVLEAAQAVHAILETAGIPSLCKTTGGRGLHIYIPLGGKYSFEDVKSFALLIAQLSHEQLPQFTSLERSPSKRKGKVYFDYLQNHFGQALVAPYCVRPRPGALVSTPLDWSEVKSGLDPAAFNLKTILKRVKKKGDLFAPLLGKGIDMLRCLKKLQSG